MQLEKSRARYGENFRRNGKTKENCDESRCVSHWDARTRNFVMSVASAFRLPVRERPRRGGVTLIVCLRKNNTHREEKKTVNITK